MKKNLKDALQKRLGNYQQSLQNKGATTKPSSEIFTDIPLSQLKVAPWNARRYFDENQLTQLGQDLQQQGQLHPISVRQKNNGYEIIVGERRYRAAKGVGLPSLKARIIEADDPTAQRLSLSENLSREDLNPFEETTGYIQLLLLELQVLPEFKAFREKKELDELAVARLLRRYANEVERSENNVILTSTSEASKQVRGTPLEAVILSIFNESAPMTWQSFVKNRLPVLTLSSDILQALQTGQLEYTKALAMSKVKDEAKRTKLLEHVIKERLSLADIRVHVKTLQAPKKKLKQADLYSRATSFAHTLKKSRVLKDAATRKKVEKLLSELEQLVSQG